MTKGRLEAFSDGVLAIIITIMVLELKVPHGGDWAALRPIAPVFLAYVLSFTNIGIYWNNHHHMLHMTDRINGKILWANLHLLFWLSLVPVTTAWMGDNHRAPLPTAVYGVVLLASGIAYVILERLIIAEQGAHSKLAAAIGPETKGWISTALYMTGVGLAFVNPSLAQATYALVALMWFVPDRRIERALKR